MENKNFEKKHFEEFNYSSIDANEIAANTWNTCLDRTNAKGIYEAASKFLDAISKKNRPADLYLLKNKLRAELKKAEQ